MWNLSYNKGEQRKPFISGNIEEHGMQLKAPSIYWGIIQALSGYYKKMRKMHSNCVNDYIYWFMVVLAIIFVIVGVS